MKYFSILFACVLLGVSPPKYVLDKIQKNTVLVTFSDHAPDHDEYVCTGVIIGRIGTTGTNLAVVTAAHCALPSHDDANPAVIDIPDTRTIRAETLDGNKSIGPPVIVAGVHNDDVVLMYMAFKRRHLSYAIPEKKPLHLFQPLYAYGHPGYSYWLFQHAVYTGVPDDNWKYPQWAYDLQVICPLCEEGDSGAGLWTTDGYLAGIINSSDSHYAYFLSIGRVRHVLGF
jgi:hypothetical protein